MSKNGELGAFGESMAGRFLIDKGYSILETNWRSGNLEIDIIASKNQSISLVEVKTRASNSYGGAVDQLTKQKIANLKRAAVKYSIQHSFPLKNLNLEFIAIDLDKRTNLANIKHFIDII